MAKSKTTNKSSLGAWADVDDRLRVIAINKAFVGNKEAAMNKKLLEIQQAHEEATLAARTNIVAAEKEIEMFCLEHRDEFMIVKTKPLNYGLVSFRLTTPKLNLLKGFTWETALKLFKKLGMTEFVRTKEELDKDAVKAKLTEPRDLAEVGLAITQGETFYYEVFEKAIV